MSFHVLETLSVSVFLCVHVGGESGLGEPTTQIPHLVLRTIPGLHWVWMHVVLAFLYPCLLTLLISLFFSPTQCPSERPQLIPTAGGGPPTHWLPPEFFCVPIVTTTSMLVHLNGLSALQPPPTEASHPSCCSRHPANLMEPQRALEATPLGPAAAPRHSTGWVVLVRMARGHSHIGMWGKKKLGHGQGVPWEMINHTCPSSQAAPENTKAEFCLLSPGPLCLAWHS